VGTAPADTTALASSPDAVAIVAAAFTAAAPSTSGPDVSRAPTGKTINRHSTALRHDLIIGITDASFRAESI